MAFNLSLHLPWQLLFPPAIQLDEHQQTRARRLYGGARPATTKHLLQHRDSAGFRTRERDLRTRNSSACRGAQPCLVRERGGGTRGGAERGWKQTRPPAGRRCAMAHAAACAVVLLGKTGLRRRAGGRKPAGRVVFIAAAADRSVERRSRRRGRKKKQVEFAPETCGCGEEVVWEIRPGSRRLGTWMRAWAWRRRSVSSGQGFG